MPLDQLPSQYVQIALRGALPCLVVNHPLFQAELLLQGAQLLRFNPTDQASWLWLSEQARYEEGQSVRGGIPICWPWFGNANKNPQAVCQNMIDQDNAPAHGFARALPWHLDSFEEDDQRVVMTLSLPQITPPHWQAQLTLCARFELQAHQLRVTLSTHNPNNYPVSFSQALHSYFATSDITATELQGLSDKPYIDTMCQWQRFTQQGAVVFQGETDRIYYNAKDILCITPSQQLRLSSEGSNSAVVWNPWIEKSKRLSQFSDDAWMGMFCVETANALDDAVTLAPNATHHLSLCLTQS